MIPETTAAPAQGLQPSDANRAMLFVLVAPSLLLALFSAVMGGGLAIALTGALTLALLFVVFKAPMEALLRDPWLKTAPQFGVVLGTTLLAFFASRGVILFVSSVAPRLLEAAPEYERLVGSASALDLALTFLGVAILVPLYEELVFRGLALRAYGRVRSAMVAATMTALLFAVVHVLPMQVLPILPLGFILARAVQSRGSFWTAVLVHVFNNALAVALLAYLLRQGEELDALARAQEPVPLAAGLVGLGVAAACLMVALAWLRVPERAERERGPIFSWSLALLLGFSLVPFLGVLLGLEAWRF